MSYFYPFGFNCYVDINGKNNLGKLDPRSYEGILLGYCPSSSAYRVFNKYTLSVEESLHVVFYDTNPRMQNLDKELSP